MYTQRSSASVPVSNLKPLVIERPKTTLHKRLNTPLNGRNHGEFQISTDSDLRIIQMNELFDRIVYDSQLYPFITVIEAYLKIAFSASKVYFWIYCPESSEIYSKTLNMYTSTDIFPGFAILTNNVIQISQNSPFSKGYQSDTRICNQGDIQLLFPIKTLMNFRGLIQIIRPKEANIFTNLDVQTALFFMEKLYRYSYGIFSENSIGQFSMNLFTSSSSVKDPCDILQIIFQSSTAEIWHFDAIRNKIDVYDPNIKTLVPVTVAKIGIVEYSIMNNEIINEEQPETNPNYSAEVDGLYEGNLFIVPYIITANEKWALAFRGGDKKYNYIDELSAKALFPFIIKAINGYIEYEDKNIPSSRLQDLYNFSITISSVTNVKELIVTSQNILSLLSDCEKVVIYLYDHRERIMRGKITTIHDEFQEFPVERGLSGHIIQLSKRVSLSKIDNKTEFFDPDIDCPQNIVPHGLIGCPIVSPNENITLGSIILLNRSNSGNFILTDEKILTAASIFIGIALTNANKIDKSVKFSNNLMNFVDSIKNKKAHEGDLLNLLRSVQNVTKWHRITVFTHSEETKMTRKRMNIGTDPSNYYGSRFAEMCILKRRSTENDFDSIMEMLSKQEAKKITKLQTTTSIKVSQLFSAEALPEIDDNVNYFLIDIPLYMKESIVGVLEILCQDDIASQEKTLAGVLALAIERIFPFLNYDELQKNQSEEHIMNHYISDEEKDKSEIPLSLKLSSSQETFDLSSFDTINLVKVAFDIFSKSKVMEKFFIASSDLYAFLVSLNESSSKSYFHSFEQSIETLKSANYFLSRTKIDDIKPCKEFAMYMSCLFKCLATEPETNAQIELEVSSAASYKKSLIKGFKILSNSDVVKNITKNDLRIIYSYITKFVVGFSMSGHATEMSKITEFLKSGEWDPSDNDEHQDALLLHILRAADLSTVSKSHINHSLDLVRRCIVEGLPDMKIKDAKASLTYSLSSIYSVFNVLSMAVPYLHQDVSLIINDMEKLKNAKI